jgi:hypothetical protein
VVRVTRSASYRSARRMHPEQRRSRARARVARSRGGVVCGGERRGRKPKASSLMRFR